MSSTRDAPLSMGWLRADEGTGDQAAQQSRIDQRATDMLPVLLPLLEDSFRRLDGYDEAGRT